METSTFDAGSPSKRSLKRASSPSNRSLGWVAGASSSPSPAVLSVASLGAPSVATLKTAGEGLELAPVTHPNDLFEGEEARFKLLLDGEPASNVEVSIVRGGNRYRDSLDEIKLTTEDDGSFAVTWPEPGMYWLQASATDDKTTIDKASERRLGYVATLEVLPE